MTTVGRKIINLISVCVVVRIREVKASGKMAWGTCHSTCLSFYRSCVYSLVRRIFNVSLFLVWIIHSCRRGVDYRLHDPDTQPSGKSGKNVGRFYVWSPTDGLRRCFSTRPRRLDVYYSAHRFYSSSFWILATASTQTTKVKNALSIFAILCFSGQTPTELGHPWGGV